MRKVPRSSLSHPLLVAADINSLLGHWHVQAKMNGSYSPGIGKTPQFSPAKPVANEGSQPEGNHHQKENGVRAKFF